MAHPSLEFPKNIYIISADAVDGPASPDQGVFVAINCSVAGSVIVKGGGIYEYKDVTDSIIDYGDYINPSTGDAFVDDATMNDAGDGFYEALDSVEVTIPMIPGQTIYGRFNTVESDGTFTGFAYA